MKKIFILSLIVLGFVGKDAAATYTWSLTTAGNASSASSWLRVPVGAGAPGIGDDVIFTSLSSTDCNWDITTVNSFSVLTGYNGVITMAAGARNIRGNFVVNSGTVVSTGGILSKLNSGLGAVFTVGAGGIFSHNNGTFVLNVDGGDVYTFSGNVILNNLTIGAVNNPGERIIAFGSNAVANNFSLGSASDEIAFQGTLHVKSSLNLSGASYANTLANPNSGTFIFDGTSVSIAGALSAASVWLPNIQMAANYSISDNINMSGSWTAVSGLLTSGSSAVNMYGASTSINGAAQFDNLKIFSGASVTFPSNTNVNIGKDFSVSSATAVIIPTDNTLVFNSSTTQGITGSFTAGNITVSSGATTINSGSAITLINDLTVNGTLNAGTELLTLRATSSGAARVAQSSGTINGDLVVETFLPGNKTGWANLGVKGVTGETIANWDTYVSSSHANGIPMTCENCAYGVTASGSYFESIQGWNESHDTYDTTLTASSPLTPGKGFWVYVGDGASTTSDLKLINKGPVVQGNQLVSVTGLGAGYSSGDFGNSVWANLIANPYPSPISADALLLFDFTNSFNFNYAIYVWDADQGASGAYATYVNGFGDGVQTNVIPAGQGFYVEYNGNGGTNTDISFDESMKISGSDPVLKQSASSIGKALRLRLKGMGDENTTAFRIHPSATSHFDGKWDARKIFQSPGYEGFPGSYAKYTTLSSKDAFGIDYSIQSIPSLTSNVAIPVLAKVSTTGSYTISAYDFADIDPSVCITLHDKLNNSYSNLRMGDYSFTISDTTSAPRFELLLCRDESVPVTGIAEQTTSGSILINQDQQGAFVKTVFTENTKATISAYNIVGQKIMEDIKVEGLITNTYLSLDVHNQVVLIRVVTEKEATTKKIITH